MNAVMRKHIMLLLCLSLHAMARGQTGYDYRYWFDHEPKVYNSSHSASSSWQMEADLSNLSDNFHAIHMQIIDGEGRASTPLTRHFLKMSTASSDLTGRYWLDRNSQNLKTTCVTQGVFDIDVSALPEGFHTLHYIGVGQHNTTSAVKTAYFYRGFDQEAKNRYRCWFDNDNSTVQQGLLANGAVMLDVTGLRDGFHTVQVMVGNVGYSLPSIAYFLKLPQTEGISHITGLSFVDNQLYKQELLPVDGGLMHWDMDVNSLKDGIHHLQLMAITPSGTATSMRSSLFIRVPSQQDMEQMKMVYYIDGGDAESSEGSRSGQAFHFDVDVTNLSDGLHRIGYMMADKNGNGSHVQTRFFMKTPLGGNGVTQYDYWLNDSISKKHQVILDSRQNPFQLITLLPVETHPLRSSNFQFELASGQPTIYARNTIHLRFFDAAGWVVTENQDYVDYQVSQTITDMELLESGKRATVNRPAKDVIKWYKVTVQAGDSLYFQLDRAATLQAFSPTGKEVFTASGIEAVNGNGINAEETGTYYIALHDVTATYGNTVSIDYQHIDRYAVLQQDVKTVGNGGPSTITFQGNGFNELTSVDLMLGETVISQQAMDVDGKATVSLKFDFGGAVLGQYKGVFHFAEGNVTVEKCITVEEALPDSVSHSVTFAKQFLLSQGNTYYYKVRNHSNQTAYNVPLTLRVVTTDAENLAQVAIDGQEDNDFDELTNNDETMRFGYERRYMLRRTLRPSGSEPLSVKVKTNRTDSILVYLDGVGGASQPVKSIDPNDIYGYQDEYGSKVIHDGLTEVYYTIEFENDPEFATAAAHDIYVTDVLDPALFDLTTFAPTRIKIGDKETELNGEKNGIVTLDMRSDINAIAQVEWTFNEDTGKVYWHISSLDPQTMESTIEPMDGVLPVNNNGNGIGQLSFDISLKPGLPDGTEIPNKAVITFDENESIETPTWVNTISNSDVKMGDVNGDGMVNLTDASWIVRTFVGRKPTGFIDAAADVNGDGNVNLSDARKIVGIFVGKKD